MPRAGFEPATTRAALGLHMPIHATGAGKALVSYDSDDELRKLFFGELPRFTKATRTNDDDLLKEVALVRERGYATDLEEFEEGLRCIGAPVRDYTRKVVGTMSVLQARRTGLPTRGSPPWSARSLIGRERPSPRASVSGNSRGSLCRCGPP